MSDLSLWESDVKRAFEEKYPALFKEWDFKEGSVETVLANFPDLKEHALGYAMGRRVGKNVDDSIEWLRDATEYPQWFTKGIQNLVGPIEPGLHVIAAHSGCGKTAFAQNQVRWFERNKIGCEVLPLEVPAKRAQAWYAGMCEGVPRWKFLRKDLLTTSEIDRVRKRIEELREATVVWSSAKNMKAEAVVERLTLTSMLGIKVMIVDHLHHVTLEGDTTKGMDELVRRLSEKAGELDMQVIAMAQFRKSLERGAKWRVPDIETIKGASAIVEVSESVMLINRAVQREKLSQFKAYLKGQATPQEFEASNTMVLSLAKSRNGLPLGTIKLNIEADTIRDCVDWDVINREDQ